MLPTCPASLSSPGRLFVDVVEDVDGGIVEREAEGVYRVARCDPREGARPIDLVRALLGPAAVASVPFRLVSGGGALVRYRGQFKIYIRRGLPPAHARFTVLHELAHFVLGERATEDECDALAARLLAPRPAFERALRETGPSYTRLARWFGCTETFAALRYGEVTDEPLVVVAPANVRIRGRSYSWPSEPELRGLAKARSLRGISKARLRDDPVRVAMRAG
jgi:hypothetical protein